eukprot:4878049-Lingulodinium_polyedra.AAC.1
MTSRCSTTASASFWARRSVGWSRRSSSPTPGQSNGCGSTAATRPPGPGSCQPATAACATGWTS